MRKALLLIQVTGHFVVVQGNRFVDSKASEIVLASAAPGRRKRVCRVWSIVPSTDGAPARRKRSDPWPTERLVSNRGPESLMRLLQF